MGFLCASFTQQAVGRQKQETKTNRFLHCACECRQMALDRKAKGKRIRKILLQMVFMEHRTMRSFGTKLNCRKYRVQNENSPFFILDHKLWSFFREDEKSFLFEINKWKVFRDRVEQIFFKITGRTFPGTLYFISLHLECTHGLTTRSLATSQCSKRRKQAKGTT